jgi:hypothetical protein
MAKLSKAAMATRTIVSVNEAGAEFLWNIGKDSPEQVGTRRPTRHHDTPSKLISLLVVSNDYVRSYF